MSSGRGWPFFSGEDESNNQAIVMESHEKRCLTHYISVWFEVILRTSHMKYFQQIWFWPVIWNIFYRFNFGINKCYVLFNRICCVKHYSESVPGNPFLRLVTAATCKYIETYVLFIWSQEQKHRLVSWRGLILITEQPNRHLKIMSLIHIYNIIIKFIITLSFIIGIWYWQASWIRICCLQNGSYFVLASMYQIISMASCQKGPTCHAYTWQIGPFWQDTLHIRHGSTVLK